PKSFGAIYIFHVDGNFDFEHVDAIAILAEFLHAGGDNLWLLLSVFQPFFVGTFFIAYEFKKERNVVAAALVPDTLDPGMFLFVDVLGIEGGVVKQNFQTVGARFFQPAHRPQVKQIPQAAGTGLVVAGLFVGQQQSGILGSAFGSR